ncbi:MAG: histidine kinase [Ignavibacteriales bacterium]|nr:histidine kinase [Ignavibacteriales bacterium]
MSLRNWTSYLLVCFFLMHGIAAGQAKQLTVRVIAPHTTPTEGTRRNEQLFIAGNHPKLGDWNPGAVTMNRENDSAWSFAVDVSVNARVEFKITRGTWNSQAVYQKGIIPPNTVVVMARDTVIVLHPVSWSDQSAPAGGGTTGTVKYHRDLEGNGLRYKRDLIVWLPPSYEKEKSKRYPVLYAHDGQNIFDPSTSFIGYDWHVDEAADSLIRAGKMQEIIIVGICNSPDRGPEYSNTELGKAYAMFVVRQVKPLIDSTYRTKSDRLNTATMGSSMGGHISFLFTWWYPDIFYQAACLSPAFYTPVLDEHGKPTGSLDDRTLQQVRTYTGEKKEIRIYMDCGGVGMEESLKSGMDMMADILAAKGFVEEKDFQVFFDVNADHSERSWAARVWRPLEFMFGR